MAKQRKNLGPPSGPEGSRVFEIVLKGDVAGTVEAARTHLDSISVPGVDVKLIQEGVGPVSKSDLFMAQTGSRLVAGFNVGVVPKAEESVRCRWKKER